MSVCSCRMLREATERFNYPGKEILEKISLGVDVVPPVTVAATGLCANSLNLSVWRLTKVSRPIRFSELTLRKL